MRNLLLTLGVTGVAFSGGLFTPPAGYRFSTGTIRTSTSGSEANPTNAAQAKGTANHSNVHEDETSNCTSHPHDKGCHGAGIAPSHKK